MQSIGEKNKLISLAFSTWGSFTIEARVDGINFEVMYARANSSITRGSERQSRLPRPRKRGDHKIAVTNKQLRDWFNI
jgi:hypothetical protein